MGGRSQHGLIDCESVLLLGLLKECSSSSALPSPGNPQITKWVRYVRHSI